MAIKLARLFWCQDHRDFTVVTKCCGAARHRHANHTGQLQNRFVERGSEADPSDRGVEIVLDMVSGDYGCATSNASQRMANQERQWVGKRKLNMAGNHVSTA
jgi:hypothetical protein